MKTSRHILVPTLLLGIPIVLVLLLGSMSERPRRFEASDRQEELPMSIIRTPVSNTVIPTALVLNDSLTEGELVAAGAGAEGRLVLVYATSDSTSRRGESHGHTFTQLYPSEPQDYRVVILRFDRDAGDEALAVEQIVVVEGLPYTVTHAALVSEHVLLAVARTDEGVTNGRLYSRSGDLVRELFFGDGIEDIHSAIDSTIWVTYFDEGVYSGIEGALGWSGLIRVSQEGETLYTYDRPDGLDIIDDCYASSVTDSALWTYYYTEFRIVRIENDEVTGVWDPGLSGASEIVVDYPYALLYGSYDNPNQISVFRLHEEGMIELVERFNPIGAPADTEPIEAHVRIARDGRLWLIRGSEIFLVDLSEYSRRDE